MQSGIFSDIDSDDVYVVFGGKIAMQASISHKSKFIMLQMQQLDKEYEIGDKHNEKWDDSKQTVSFVFDNSKSIDVVLNALNQIKNKFNELISE